MIKVTRWHLSKVTAADVCREHRAAFVSGLLCCRESAGSGLFISPGLQNQTRMLSYICLCFLLHTSDFSVTGSAGTQRLCLVISSLCEAGQCGIYYCVSTAGSEHEGTITTTITAGNTLFYS